MSSRKRLPCRATCISEHAHEGYSGAGTLRSISGQNWGPQAFMARWRRCCRRQVLRWRETRHWESELCEKITANLRTELSYCLSCQLILKEDPPGHGRSASLLL